MTSALTLILLAAAAAPATPIVAVPATPVARLAHLTELWATVKFRHPFLAYRRVDWDGALIAAAPRVRAAVGVDGYAAAVSAMLDVLHDPATHVLRPDDGGPPSRPPPAGKVLRPLGHGKLLLDLTVLHGELPTDEEARAINAALARAPGVVVDLRVGSGAWWLASLPFSAGLVSHPMQAPARRALLHAGYRPQGGISSGGYDSMMTVLVGERFQPPPGAVAKRVAFLVQRDGPLLPVALALRASGAGALVAQGPLDDQVTVHQVAVDLGEGLMAAVRIDELEGGPLRADVTVRPGDDPVAAALAWIEHGKPLRRRPAAPLPPPVWTPDGDGEDGREYPDPSHRLLAVARLWSVIHFFYPYMPLIGEDWNRTVLPRFIPRVERARDGMEYALAIAEMATFVPDGHTSVMGGPLDRFFGAAQPPLTLRVVEGVPVVEEIHGAAAGVALGDVVVAVDGEPALARMQRLGKYLAASHETAHQLREASQLLGGAEGSVVLLTLRGADGRDRPVRLPRTMTGEPPPHRGGEVTRVLPRNIGYIDLERLEPADVGAALERVKGTRGLVLDLRGYPRPTAWELASRLNVTGAPWGAAFQRPLVGGDASLEDDGSGGRLSFMQPLPPARGWVYDRPVVILIDERAISRAEHTALFLEAACHPRFVGTPTAGANGDVTTFPLPGGLRVWFTGHDVRHADGRQLQRVGIQPHVRIAPTIAGLRAGRDEVLERALREIP